MEILLLGRALFPSLVSPACGSVSIKVAAGGSLLWDPNEPRPSVHSLHPFIANMVQTREAGVPPSGGQVSGAGGSLTRWDGCMQLWSLTAQGPCVSELCWLQSPPGLALLHFPKKPVLAPTVTNW